ncbi:MULTISPECIES: hypothetical protein [unclassified Clostridium]|uniref:hypothetical protein n=1 Tax=unclassified Clostridium TaxID=2614128 RepID=UPI00207AE8F2|nr:MULTISPECIES: hypothetical protein [unclassified Clostridium]
MKIDKKELMSILGVKRAGLKAIEKRSTLDRRLEEKGYNFMDKVKEGRKVYYIIKKIPNFKPILHKFAKKISNLKIPEDKWENTGIYYIILNKDIYIGSTINSFRNRCKQHLNGNDPNMTHTYDLLHNDGTFHILYDMTNIKDEILIRMVEQEYIDYFINYTDFNVINKREYTYTTQIKREKAIKYKYIMVNSKQFNKAIELLKYNNIDMKERKKTNDRVNQR